VNSYSGYGANAITLDRLAENSTICVKFKL